MLKLVIADDEGKQTVVPMVREEITIGRLEGNTIRLTERNVSRRHGRLVRENGNLYFEEVSARYGTFMNGDRVRGRVQLRSGDVLTIGDYRLFLQNPDGSMPVAAQPPRQAAPTHETTPEQRDATEVLQLPSSAPAMAPTTPAKLCIINTELAGSEFALLKDASVIGRTDENDIFVNHRSISRHHARVDRIDSLTYRVQDLGSANGVRVNGQPATSMELRRGDVIELGTVQFRFVAPGEVFSAASVRAAAAPAADKGGGMGKMIGVFAVLLLVVGGIVAFVVFGGGDGGETNNESTTTTQPETGGPGSQVAPDTGTGAVAVVTPNTQAEQQQQQTTPVTPGVDYGAIVAQGEAAMREGRWDDAVASFSQVPPGVAEYAAADQAQIRARAERRNQDTWDRMAAAEQASNYPDAMAALAEIPEDSFYRQRLQQEGVQARIQDAWIRQAVAASEQAAGRGRFEEARQALQGPMAAFPQAPELTMQMNAIASAETQATARAEREEQERLQQQQQQANNQQQQQQEEEEEEEVVVVRTPPEEEEEEEEEEPELSREERRTRASELIRQARREGLAGRHSDAIELLQQAQELDDSDASAYLMLYTNYSRTGDNRRAARALREYVSRRPDDPNAASYRQIIEDLEQ